MVKPASRESLAAAQSGLAVLVVCSTAMQAYRSPAGLSSITVIAVPSVAALRPDSAGAQRHVVVAARDLSPGVALTADDVTVQNRPAATLPDGAQTGLDRVLGATLAGPSRRGEVLTDARVLGSRLTGLSAGPDARVVPLRLSDPAVADLIRPGDVVDVLGAPEVTADAHPRVVARNAVVVLVTAAKTVGGTGDRVVLVALPAAAATALAGATLVQTVTVTIH